jgi:maleate isomerase
MIMRHVGLIIPSINTVLEQDLRHYLPKSVVAHVTRLRLTGTSPIALRQFLEEVPIAASLLSDAGVCAIGLACTGASMLQTTEPTVARVNRTEDTVEVPVTTMFDAIVEAFGALSARRIAVFSPFDDGFNDNETAAFERQGIGVVNVVGLGIADPRRCAVVTPEEIISLGNEIDHTDAEALFVGCANLRGLEAVAPLEAAMGKPVVTSNQALLWKLLSLVGKGGTAFSGGRLDSSLQREFT